MGSCRWKLFLGKLEFSFQWKIPLEFDKKKFPHDPVRHDKILTKLSILTVFLFFFGAGGSRWKFLSGNFVEISKWNFPSGNFQVELSKWNFPGGTFQVEISTWKFPPGSFHLEISIWKFPLGNFHLEISTWSPWPRKKKPGKPSILTILSILCRA